MQIFGYFILDTHEACRRETWTVAKPYAWLSIRQVCRLWREIALTYPQLSTYICLVGRDWVQDLLSRSGTLPIRIYEPTLPYPPPEWRYWDAHCLILDNLERISDATLNFTPLLIGSGWFPTVHRHGVSQLRSLRISLREDRAVEDALFPNFQFPRLEELCCVYGSLGSLRPMLVPSLRSLSLCCTNTMSPTGLMTALESLQSLEELGLEGVCTGFKEALRASIIHPNARLHTHITLPHLRRLSIREHDAADGIYVFQRISYHTTASVQLHFALADPEFLDVVITSVVSKLQDGGPFGGPLSPRSMSITLNQGLLVSLVLWDHYLPVHDMKAGSQSSAFFRFSMDHIGEWAARLLRQMDLSTMESTLLAELVVTETPMCRLDILSSMTGLHELGLEYESFQNAIDDMPRNSRLLYDVEFSLRALQSVWIREYGHSASSEGTRRPSELAFLARTLSTRSEGAGSSPRPTIDRELLDFHGEYPCHCQLYNTSYRR